MKAYKISEDHYFDGLCCYDKNRKCFCADCYYQDTERVSCTIPRDTDNGVFEEAEI